MNASMFFQPRRMSALRATIFVLAAASFAAPVMAQQQTPVTRAQVRAELAGLIAAGYNPLDKYHYPENLWAAQQRVRANEATLAQASEQRSAQPTQSAADTSSAPMTDQAVGGAKSGTSMSGSAESEDIPSTCHGFPVCHSAYFGR